MTYVIIVTFNGIRWIDRCLTSVLNDKGVSAVIVIDNGSTDGTAERISETYPVVRLIVNKHNFGFGHSNNQGLKIALEEGAEYAFLLNQDAWIMPDTISALTAVHKNSKEFGILSPIHLRGDGNAIDMKFGMFVTQSENHNLLSDLLLHREHMDEVYSVSFVNAAAWMVTRDCLEKVGGFASVYHHYGEDMDYANRARYHQFKIGICPSQFIFHDRKNVVELPNINAPERYLKIRKVLHLIYLTDIMHNTGSRFFKLLFKAVLDIIKYIGQLKFTNGYTVLKELALLIGMFPAILRNNARTRKGNGAFLITKQ